MRKTQVREGGQRRTVNFLGGTVTQTPRSQCRGHRFNPGWELKMSYAAWCKNILKRSRDAGGKPDK